MPHRRSSPAAGSQMSTTASTRLRSTVERIPNPLPYPVSVAGKFLFCGTVGQLTWLMFIAYLQGGEMWSANGAEEAASMSTEGMLLLGVMTLPALAVAGVYTYLPDETTDIFHRFGKGSALFFALNVSLSGSMIAWQLVYTDLTLAAPFDIIGSWAIASVSLPGLYVGCLVAARWAR